MENQKIQFAKDKVLFLQNLYNRTGTGYAFLVDAKNELKKLEGEK